MTPAGRPPAPTPHRAFAVVALLVLLSVACARPRTVTAVPPPPRPAEAPAGTPSTPTIAPVAPAPARVAPRGPAAPCAACTPAQHLASELDAIFASPAVQRAVLGIEVRSLDTGEALYELNPDTLLVPASNVKIVTLAVAAARLGWDHRFETRLETSASLVGGTLNGDLVIVGGGDPTIGVSDEEGSDPALDQMAEGLLAAGVRRITGRIVGDGRAFSGLQWGFGWGWDDFAHGYQAPVSALQYNENLVYVTIRPGVAVGDPAVVAVRPDGSGLLLANRVTTGARGTPTDIDLFRFPGTSRLELRGAIAAGGPDVTREAAVADPTLFFARAFRTALLARGVTVDGEASSLEIPDEAAPPIRGEQTATAVKPDSRVLVRHLSPKLSEVGRTLMKVSQNLYAETLLRALSLAPGPATVEASQKIEEDVLASWGIAPGEYALADGSGLSRHNLFSAGALLRVLQAVARSPELAGAFEATLPIAGRDGTLANRMRATRAEGRVRAKSGSLMRVRALSGYVTTADGERLVFSMIANHYTAPTKTVDALMDQALERLASFSRRPAAP